MTTTLWVCPSCGTLDVEGGECCDVQRVPFEEALGTQEVLFELTGNDRAQHVLHQLKSLFESAAEKVNKTVERLDAAQRQKEAAGAVLLDFYKLTFVPEETPADPTAPAPSDVCPSCSGDGRVPDKTGGGHHKCKACKGSGKVSAPDPLADIAEKTAAAFNSAQIEADDFSATAYVGVAAGNLFATSASMLHKAMLENGMGRWSNGGVTYELTAADGRLVLLIGGASEETAEADAHLLGTVAGTTFTADYTEALKAGVAHAFVAADPR